MGAAQELPEEGGRVHPLRGQRGGDREQQGGDEGERRERPSGEGVRRAVAAYRVQRRVHRLNAASHRVIVIKHPREKNTSCNQDGRRTAPFRWPWNTTLTLSGNITVCNISPKSLCVRLKGCLILCTFIITISPSIM